MSFALSRFGAIIDHEESVHIVGALNLQEAAGRMPETCGEHSAGEHRVYHCAFAVRCAPEEDHLHLIPVRHLMRETRSRECRTHQFSIGIN